MVKKESKPILNSITDGYYDEQTDVMEIHAYVEEYFRKRKEDIPAIERQISILRQRLVNERMLMIDRHHIEMKITTFEKKCQALLTEDDQRDYVRQITPFLEEWKALQEEEGPYLRFGEKENFSPDKLFIIRNCVQIAAEYTPLNLTMRPYGKSGHCPRCRKPYLDNDEGKIICEKCGVYRDLIIHNSDFSDFNRVNASGSNDYDNEDTFKKTMNKYQGKQQPEFPDQLGSDFDQYCRENRINPKVLTQETTRPIFKKLGYKDFYDDINLFLHLHLNRTLPDLSEYESTLLEDYEAFSREYNDIKGEERDSALGAQYLLYILVRRRNIPHAKEDFHLPDTKSILVANDNISRRVFNNLGWIFIDLV